MTNHVMHVDPAAFSEIRKLHSLYEYDGPEVCLGDTLELHEMLHPFTSIGGGRPVLRTGQVLYRRIEAIGRDGDRKRVQWLGLGSIATRGAGHVDMAKVAPVKQKVLQAIVDGKTGGDPPTSMYLRTQLDLPDAQVRSAIKALLADSVIFEFEGKYRPCEV